MKSMYDFQIQVYDFLAHGIFSDYNGLLGLYFLEGIKCCVVLSHKKKRTFHRKYAFFYFTKKKNLTFVQ
jgi:hypothetical protein